MPDRLKAITDVRTRRPHAIAEAAQRRQRRRFLLLIRGRNIGYYPKEQITRDELTGLMAGGGELEELSHELEAMGGAAADAG
jgi:hypothetical protein